MNVTVTAENIGGTVEILSSKSELHRLMLLASLSDTPTTITYSGVASKDVIATADCINAVGGKAKVENGKIEVSPIKVTDKTCYVCPNESGSTLRFILPVFSALGIDYEVTVNGRLGSRPLSPLYEIMLASGVSLSENGVYPLKVKGKLNSSFYQIDGSVSSQFITGLLMSLPINSKIGKVQVVGDFQSQSYVDVTVDAMSKFGAVVTKTEHTYDVKCDKYTSCGQIKAGGDWSNGAFFLCAGALCEKGVTVKGLDKNSKQGDKKILCALEKMGAKITWNGDDVTVKKGNLQAITLDVADIPDLVPILAIVASVSKGVTRIENGARLRLKESDRISSVVAMINALGGKATEGEDYIIIEGVDQLSGGVVDGANDHRIVMASAIASVVSSGKITILGAQAVQKSYPDFFEVITKIGLASKEACNE